MKMVIFLVTCGFLASLLSGSTGFGGASLLTPILTYCLGTKRAVPVLTITMLIGNAARAGLGFKEIAWKKVGLFLCTAAPLSALGALGFTVLPASIVTRIIGLSMVIFVLVKNFGKREFKVTNKETVGTGGLVGLLSGLVGSAGPISAVLFFSMNLSPIGYIASEAAATTVLHIIKTIIYGKLLDLSLKDWLLGLGMGSVMILGTYIAKKFVERVSIKNFHKLVSVFLVIMGIYMMITG